MEKLNLDQFILIQQQKQFRKCVSRNFVYINNWINERSVELLN